MFLVRRSVKSTISKVPLTETFMLTASVSKASSTFIVVKITYRNPLKLALVLVRICHVRKVEVQFRFVETMNQWTESLPCRDCAQLQNSWNRPIDYKNRWANQSQGGHLRVRLY